MKGVSSMKNKKRIDNKMAMELMENVFIDKHYDEISADIEKLMTRSKTLLKLNVLYEIECCLTPWPSLSGEAIGDITIDEFLKTSIEEGKSTTYGETIYEPISNFIDKIIRSGASHAMMNLKYNATSTSKSKIIEKIMALYKNHHDMSLDAIIIICGLKNNRLSQIAELRRGGGE